MIRGVKLSKEKGPTPTGALCKNHLTAGNWQN